MEISWVHALLLLSPCVLLVQADPPTASTRAPSNTTAASTQDCPKGATRYNRTRACYWVIEQKLRWSEADRLCQRNGGSLASISDEYENAFVFDVARAANLSEKTVWLGRLTRLTTTGAYEWHDGAVGRQLDGFKQPPSGTEMCLTMWLDFGRVEGSWHEWDCNYERGHSAICKKPHRRPQEQNATEVQQRNPDVYQSRRCCMTPGCGHRCNSNERCIPDDMDCLWKTCPQSGPGWCLPFAP